jgi:glutamate mutase epsilon subunit
VIPVSANMATQIIECLISAGQEVAERERAEGRQMDCYTSIEDFWGISKGRLKGPPS